VKKIEAIAREKRCTPGQLVLAWLLAQDRNVVAIPGTKRKARVDENLGALQVKLSAQDVEKIAKAAPVGAGAGTRYPADGMKKVYL
jgi:aryl-alcohol dehydrogenase-like predicted oxidoreductase